MKNCRGGQNRVFRSDKFGGRSLVNWERVTYYVVLERTEADSRLSLLKRASFLNEGAFVHTSSIVK